MEQAAMELINVTKTIGKKKIIKGLSFEINKGEVFGFIGPNGAGKTTTIRMMVGLMKLTEGDVLIQGHSIKTDFQKAVREVGAIVENPEMYPFMTGLQNLKHYANMTPEITKERIDEVVALVGLEKVLKEKVGRYSLGMRQRLGIAQALLHHPSILILDEPTNGLDPAGIREIRQYIRRLASEENVAVIISSHLLSEIELMCDRIGIIKNGELISTQQIHGSDADKQLQQLELIATPIEKASKVLESELNIESLQIEESLTFQCERESIPNIARTLVAHDIAIYQIGRAKASLEDKFFDVIGENVIE
ncbi:ABC transporter ATP-binding protein [Virgibacillus sp. MSJ-26]|uniref:ABC transporter ATP-binding protein n=1 Tax=Virgibacillus sp. MSJ-26 TaxID=2841522 RepID=UPI001C11F8EB|nr:ABC transporter ATP-binding protein [Virgibacillus sp. MSJ-26]MBU5467530.1 ABC transporter ATP-binding protein [Virgibacillus sp. MSJ-26]